jgi:hypothetical protein
VNTIGIEVVAALATAWAPPVAMIASTGRWTISAASAGSASIRPSAHRYSILTLRCSTYPASSSPSLKAATRCEKVLGD